MHYLQISNITHHNKPALLIQAQSAPETNLLLKTIPTCHYSKNLNNWVADASPYIIGKLKTTFTNQLQLNPEIESTVYTVIINIDKHFKKIFSDYLKTNVPQIKKVIYISGDDSMPDILEQLHGGVHCMSTEKPDFKKWDELLKASK